MSDFNNFAIEKRKPLSGLQIFLIKLGAVVAAIVFLLVFSLSFVEVRIEKALGSTTFWIAVEHELYRLADEKDLPEPKKAQIIAALQKLAIKYGPYVQALVPPQKKP